MVLTAFSMVSRGYILDWSYLLFVGSSTLLTYSLHRLIGISRSRLFIHEGRFAVVKRFKNHIIFYACFSTVLCIYYFLRFDFERQLLLAGSAVISILYTLPVFGNGKRLRDFSFIKILLISFTWALVTEGVLLWEQHANTKETMMLVLERFCFILAITIPFDIRDIEVDKSQGVRTIATKLGEKVSKNLSYTLLAIAFVLAHLSDAYETPSLTAICICYSLSLIAVIYTNRSKPDYWYTGLMDGLMLIPLFMLIMLVVLGGFS